MEAREDGEGMRYYVFLLMTDDQRNFNELFAHRGGLLETSKLPKPTSTFIEHFESLFSSIFEFLKQRYPKLPPVQFGVILNPSLNAFAAKSDGKYYLGLHFGALLILHDAFNKMFASRDIQPKIGNCQLETNEKKNLSVRPENGDLIFDPSQENVKISDPIRADLARYYTDTAVSFVILHEMCHIIRGHVGYLASKKGHATWSEIALGSEQQAMGNNLWQSLEMDADSFATNHFFLLHDRNRDRFPMLIKDIKDFYSHWIFTTYVFFRLMGFNELDYESDKLFAHPPAVLRMAMVIANLRTLFDTNKRAAEGNYVMSQMGDFLEQAEKAFCSVTYFHYDPDLFKRNYLRGESYALEIAANWNKVRPLIQPFAFGELPPMVNIIDNE